MTGDFPFGDDPFDALISCASCGGDFLPEDMDGEHCRECAADIFGDSE